MGQEGAAFPTSGGKGMGTPFNRYGHAAETATRCGLGDMGKRFSPYEFQRFHAAHDVVGQFLRAQSFQRRQIAVESR